MVDISPSLQQVYAKWEKRPSSINGYTTNKQAPIIANGRQAWRDKFGDNIRPPPQRRQRNNRDRHRHGHIPIATVTRNSVIGFYKTAPTVMPHRTTELRPFMGRCCSCLPNSKNANYDESIPSMGLRDIFNIETKHKTNGILTRTFCQVAYAMRRDLSHKYPDVSLPVLISPRVREAIQKTVMEETKEISDPKEVLKHLKSCEKRTVSVLKKMKATISNHLIRFTGWFLHKLLGRLLENLVVHEGQIAMLKRVHQMANQKNVPLIFLPMHKSHLDYILVTFILHNYDICAPHVAAGDNLYIPFFRSLMKGLGGFFIRRKLDDHNGKKDLVYRATLHTYMQELLKRGENLEFFIEGGRTRTGKACTPKGGLLSVVVDAFMDESILDVYIVPMSISYEKILDGNYVREQMGEAKQKETFWMAIKGIWRVFMSKFGNVRVDFAQPFSLQEYIQVSRSFSCDAINRSPSPPSSGMPFTDPYRCRSNSSAYGMEIVNNTQRRLVKGLAEHVIYSSVQTSAVMSTQLLAFVLLTQHRQGVRFSSLASTFRTARQNVLMRQRDVGFSGETEDVIMHAVKLLGPHLVQTSSDKEVENSSSDCDKRDDLHVTPVTSLPHVFELSYYANGVASVFALESVVACSVCACLDADVVQLSPDTPVTVSRNEVMQKAKYLCQILQFEFTFIPPCTSIEVVINDAIEQLISSELLVVEERQYGYCTREREWAQRFSSALSWADDDSDEDFDLPDQQLKVNATEEQNRERFTFLQTVLGSLIETYWVVACQLLQLLEEAVTDEELYKQIGRTLLQRVETGVATYAESASMDAVKNAVKSYEQMKIVGISPKNSKQTICLHDNYQNKDAVYELITSVQIYR